MLGGSVRGLVSSLLVPEQLGAGNERHLGLLDVSVRHRRDARKIQFIIWERLPINRAAANRFQVSPVKYIQFDWLTAYAPELNREENRWSCTKFCQVGNCVPDDTSWINLSFTVHVALGRPDEVPDWPAAAPTPKLPSQRRPSGWPGS